MKNQTTFILISLFLSTLAIYGQKSETLKGHIKNDSLAISNAHILNKTNLKGVITNANGFFELPVSINDTLLISHINFDNIELIITAQIIRSRKVEVQLEHTDHVLNEVVIKKRRSIFYVDAKGIVQPPIINAKKLNLPYSNGLKATENKSTLRAESGVAVNVISLINVINGNKKREKKFKLEQIKDQRVDKIRSKFTNSFFYKQLHIKEGYINQFIEHCLSAGVLHNADKRNIISLTHSLIQESKIFIHSFNSEEKLLTKAN